MRLILAGLLLMTVNISTALAAGKCENVFQIPPSEVSAQFSLQDLARLKLYLDETKTAANSSPQVRILEKEFKLKQREFQQKTGMSTEAFHTEIKNRINKLQNKTAEAKKETDLVREEQSLIKNNITYQPVKRFEISELGPGVLAPNTKFLYLFENKDLRITAVNLENGTREHFPNKGSLVAKDRLFLKTDFGWKILELNTGKIILDNNDIPVGPLNSATISNDSKFLIGLTHDPQMKFATETQVELYDLNGKSQSKLTIPVWPINDVPYFTDQYMVIKSMQNLFVYSFATKKADLLMLKASPINPVAGTNKILVHEDGKSISLVDLDTLNIQSRQFHNIARVFYAKDDRIMISERGGGPYAHFHLINTSNFLASDESLAPRTEFAMLDIPGTDTVAVSNRYIQASEPAAIFLKDDLHSPLFTFNFSQAPGDPGQTHYQWVSEDGKKIITSVLHGRNSPTVDIWELKKEAK